MVRTVAQSQLRNRRYPKFGLHKRGGWRGTYPVEPRDKGGGKLIEKRESKSVSCH